jgi:hypothetical protein
MNLHGGDMYSGSYWSTGSLFAVSSTLAFVYDIVSEHHAPGTSNGPGFDNSVSAARRSTDIDDASGYVVKISASTPAQVNNDGAINQVFNPEHPSGEG